MKIHEITEAKKVTLGGPSMRAKQRVDPKLINMMANVSAYHQDIEKLKKQNSTTNAQPKDAEKKDNWRHTNKYRQFVRFHNINLLIALEDADIWNNHKEEDFIYDETIHKLKNKRLPEEMYNEMRQDPRWQEVVKKLWNYAGEAAKNTDEKDIDGSIFTNAGIDLKQVRETEKEYVSIFNSYLRKYGIDKTGRKIIY